jgi:hypothetical protein
MANETTPEARLARVLAETDNATLRQVWAGGS